MGIACSIKFCSRVRSGFGRLAAKHSTSLLGVTFMISIRMSFWLRVVALVGVIIFGTGVGLLAYRWYSHPVTLTLAVGSIDGEAAKAMSAMASQLVTDGASVRLKVIDSGTALEAGKQFAAGNVDLAVVRGDVGDLSKA